MPERDSTRVAIPVTAAGSDHAQTASLGSDDQIGRSATPIDEPIACGAPLADGANLGRYVVSGRVGAGATSVVYSARDPDLNRRVALKVLRPELSMGRRARARLVREAQAMAQLSHPNVVPVYDVGVFGDQVFIAMELVQGVTLRRKLPIGTAWRTVMSAYLQAARGLAAAHAAGLVHRDFKPDNVLLGDDGRVRVVDFGLVGVERDAPDTPGTDAHEAPASATLPVLQTATGAVLGTPAYMAPEGLRGEVLDARADQFSFCVALFHALYGVAPYGGATLAERAAQIARGPIARPPRTRVPAAVYHVLSRGLRADPALRYPTMEAMAGALERAITPRRRARALGIAAAIAGVGGAALAIGPLRSVAPEPGPAAGPAAPPPGLRSEFFIDAGARGPATGEPGHPYPSITAALEAANHSAAPTKTLHVAAGRYDASRETFPLELRHGVSLIGEAAPTTAIVGVARIDHAAGGTVFDEPIWVSILVGDPVERQTIRGISIDPGTAEHLPWGIYCDQGNAYPPAPGPGRAPNLTIDQIVAARFDRSIVIGTSDRPAPSGCSAVVTRSQIASKTVGVFIAGTGHGSNAPNRVSARIGGDTAADGNRFIGNRDLDRTGSSSFHRGSAITIYDNAVPIAIRHNTFNDNDIAIELNAFGDDVTSDIDDNSFTGMTYAAIVLSGNYHLHALTGNFFAGNNAIAGNTTPTCGDRLTLAAAICIRGYGTHPPGPQIQRARGNVFAGNDVALYVEGTPFLAGANRILDFGTAADPGKNQFLCNSSEHDPPGYDVWLNTGSPSATLSFAGNGWDHAVPTRGAPGARDGTDLVVVAGGPHVELAGQAHHGHPCPAPHNP
jgi:tRNA A-37 threonylcarbamoyl transferase component Bud32